MTPQPNGLRCRSPHKYDRSDKYDKQDPNLGHCHDKEQCHVVTICSTPTKAFSLSIKHYDHNGHKYHRSDALSTCGENLPSITKQSKRHVTSPSCLIFD
jgi:hypothetical protein